MGFAHFPGSSVRPTPWMAKGTNRSYKPLRHLLLELAWVPTSGRMGAWTWNVRNSGLRVTWMASWVWAWNPLKGYGIIEKMPLNR